MSEDVAKDVKKQVDASSHVIKSENYLVNKYYQYTTSSETIVIMILPYMIHVLYVSAQSTPRNALFPLLSDHDELLRILCCELIIVLLDQEPI